jgi:hypothetical protein
MRKHLPHLFMSILLFTAAAVFSFTGPLGGLRGVSDAAAVDPAHPYEFVTGAFEAKKDAGISFLISNPNPGVAGSVTIQLFTATTQVGSNFTVNAPALDTLTAILFATTTGLHHAKLSSSLDNVVIQYRYTDAASVIHFVDAGDVRAIPRPATGLAFKPLVRNRFCDTRDNGNGTACVNNRLSAGEDVAFTVGGIAGIPSTAQAVSFVVRALSPTATSYMVFYPDGVTRPGFIQYAFDTSGVDVTQLTVKLGTNDKMRMYNKAGSTDVILDAVGYYV